MTTSVLIVDDHPVVRAGLRAALSARDEVVHREEAPRHDATSVDDAALGPGTVVVVGEAATGEEAVTLAIHLRPDVVLCDLRLGAGIDGIETTRRLRALDPAPAVLILTTFDTTTDIVQAVEAGAAGYLLKDADPGEIAAAITTVGRGGAVLPPEMASRMMRAMNSPRLTAREIDVLRLVATGATNHDIARALVVTEATVKSHLVRVFTKLDVDNRSRAVVQARKLGII
jgi:DNA-binding NarL/FixJ family response regulator